MLIPVGLDNFETEVLNAKGLVLVDFWSPTCGPCELLNMVLEELAKDLKDQVKIVKVNVDKEIALADAQRIIIMPTLKIFKNGESVKDVFGVQSKDDLKAIIKTLSHN